MEDIVIPEQVWPLAWNIWEWAKPRWMELTAAAFAFVFTVSLFRAVRRRGGK